MTDTIIRIAQELAANWPRFLERLGPGHGDRATEAYMNELRNRALREFNDNFAERRIMGDNGLRVDFYFPEERTVVEVAMGLRNSNSEFERDLFKALIAGEELVQRLVFLTKPGGIARTNSPSARAIINWALVTHNLQIEVIEFSAEAENNLDDPE